MSFSIETGIEYKLDYVDNLNEVKIGVDVIDPIANPNPGPDGRIEFDLKINPAGE